MVVTETHAQHVHERRRDAAALIGAVALLILALAVLALVLWVIVSKQDSKLYQADNVVCVSQPFAVQCFERKTAP